MAVYIAHAVAQLAGPHALTAVHNYNQLIDSQFLDSLFLEGQHHVP